MARSTYEKLEKEVEKGVRESMTREIAYPEARKDAEKQS